MMPPKKRNKLLYTIRKNVAESCQGFGNETATMIELNTLKMCAQVLLSEEPESLQVEHGGEG